MHTDRDSIAEAGRFLGAVTATLSKFATDLKTMMMTEVGEAAEPFSPNRGSSSIMPPKRNPISCCYKIGRGQAHDLLYQICQQAVRDGKSLAEALKADPKMSKILSDKDVDRRTDPDDHPDSAGAMIDEVLSSFR